MEPIVQQLESFLNTSDPTTAWQTAKPLLTQCQLALLDDNGSTDLAASLSALEISAILAVQAQELESFSRIVTQLTTYYSNSTVATPRRWLVTGLYLMHLLVDHRLSEFHSTLELLNSDVIEKETYLSFPVGLERQLMVGLYDDVLVQKSPHPAFGVFMELVVATVRDAIADGLEVAYKSLTKPQAAALLKCSEQELEEYIQEHRDDWVVDENSMESNKLTFQPPAGNPELPAEEWMQQSLTYATEMERII